MKPRIGYNFWILSLTVVLMILILAAQLFTIKNIRGLKTGNQEAAVIFTINNRLQEIVNTAAVLETRMLRSDAGKLNAVPITDSLAAIGYNVSVLEKLNLDSATAGSLVKLNAFIRRQVATSLKIMEAATSGNEPKQKLYADSLRAMHSGDSIYQTAVNIEKGLEAKLKNTFNSNTEASQKLSTLNKIFAIIAIVAILILGTIIINRHLRQVSLIRALEKANEEVRKSAMIKEQFLANMSHEIRTPLNAIKGFSSLLKQTTLNAEQQKFAGIIEDSSNNLLNLVNDILDIAKIEAGKMVVERKEFELKRMLQTLESMFMNTAQEKQLHFSWQIEEKVPRFLTGDPDRIYQILINLVSNAFKFTERGFIKIAVSNVFENQHEITLLLSVQDSGIGIPPQNHELIFERFQQAGNTQEHIQKGTGLGLAIVKNMAALLGGNVTVKSAAGKGSTFSVQLPFTKNYEETEAVETNTAAINTPVLFSGAHVLVAEDNNVNQLLISTLLKQYGIKPVIAENGVEVLELLKTRQFHLLLLDIQMPLLDGYKTCAAIRESGNKLPIVAMTAYVMDAEKEKCRAAGMNDYLPKPLQEIALKNILITYLNAHIVPVAKQDDTNANNFLLGLAGGDEQMAAAILAQVKKEIPLEIEKLTKKSREKDMAGLRAVCHHLVSSISPLGNNSRAIQMAQLIQSKIATKAAEKDISVSIAELIAELESIQEQLK